MDESCFKRLINSQNLPALQRENDGSKDPYRRYWLVGIIIYVARTLQNVDRCVSGPPKVVVFLEYSTRVGQHIWRVWATQIKTYLYWHAYISLNIIVVFLTPFFLVQIFVCQQKIQRTLAVDNPKLLKIGMKLVRMWRNRSIVPISTSMGLSDSCFVIVVIFKFVPFRSIIWIKR